MEVVNVLEQARGLLERNDGLSMPSAIVSAIVGAVGTMDGRHAAMSTMRSVLGLPDKPGTLAKWASKKSRTEQIAALTVAIERAREGMLGDA